LGERHLAGGGFFHREKTALGKLRKGAGFVGVLFQGGKIVINSKFSSREGIPRDLNPLQGNGKISSWERRGEKLKSAGVLRGKKTPIDFIEKKKQDLLNERRRTLIGKKKGKGAPFVTEKGTGIKHELYKKRQPAKRGVTF